MTEVCIQCNPCNKTVTCQLSKTVMIDILLVFIKCVLFSHVVLSLIIETNYHYKFSVEEHFIEWCTELPRFNGIIFRNLHGPIFEELFVIARQDRYDLMCGLYAYNKDNDNSTDATDFGGGRPLPEYSTINPLIYPCVSINFIGTWSNILGKTFAWRCCAYQDNTKEIFKRYILKYKILLLKTSIENVRNFWLM